MDKTLRKSKNAALHHLRSSAASQVDWLSDRSTILAVRKKLEELALSGDPEVSFPAIALMEKITQKCDDNKRLDGGKQVAGDRPQIVMNFIDVPAPRTIIEQPQHQPVALPAPARSHDGAA